MRLSIIEGSVTNRSLEVLVRCPGQFDRVFVVDARSEHLPVYTARCYWRGTAIDEPELSIKVARFGKRALLMHRYLHHAEYKKTA